MTEVGDSRVVADARIRGRVKCTDSEMVFDYSLFFRIADGKFTTSRNSENTTTPSPLSRPPSAAVPRA
jgi:ketosteroid isomerase-like protein